MNKLRSIHGADLMKLKDILYVWLLILIISLMVSGGISLASASQVQEFYVAPELKGNGKGGDTENAAYFGNQQFWARVQSSLVKGPVTVNFLPGEYIIGMEPKQGEPILGVIPNIFSVKTRDPLKLSNMGHNEHQLILQGMDEKGTVFMSDPDEPLQENKSFQLFNFKGKNTIIRNLHFTGAQYMGYVTRINGENILVENCSWIDLPRTYYGATGTVYDTTQYVIYKDCVFIRVGLDSHAHMSYNAYGSKHIYFINCYFEDCSGDYVRYRDKCDYGIVYGCTFKSTGTYVGANRAFISVPLFNDDDPEKNNPKANYEYFGTNFLIANNTFIYPDDYSGGQRRVLQFLHHGFDPPGRNYLLTTDEFLFLLQGSVEEKRTFMKDRLGLNWETIHFFNNEFKGWNNDGAILYESRPKYGATSRGWEGYLFITETVNKERVVENVEEALNFWK